MLPPFTDLRSVQTLIDGDRLELGTARRTCRPTTAAPTPVRSRGAFLAKLGCTYVVVGPQRAPRVPRGARRRGQRQGPGGLPARPHPDPLRRRAAAHPPGRGARRATSSRQVEAGLAGVTAEQAKTSSSPTSRSGPSAPVRSPRREDAQEVCARDPHQAGRALLRRPGRRRAGPLRRLGQGQQRRGDHGAGGRRRRAGRRRRRSTRPSSPRSAATGTTWRPA